MRNQKILVIFLDAAEHSLVERWMQDGSLPTLSALRARGCYAVLGLDSDELNGQPWPTFYTGQNPGQHGIYHYLQWQPDASSTRRISKDWPSTLKPFWRSFGEAEPFVVALDVPGVSEPVPFNGIELVGWATHDTLAYGYYEPHQIEKSKRSALEDRPVPNEKYGLLPAGELKKIALELEAAPQRMTQLAKHFYDQPWNLFMIGFSSTHRGGHKFWDLSGAYPVPSESDAAVLKDALRKVYMACDQAVGQLLKDVGQDVVTLVVAAHGMRENYTRTTVVSEILANILSVEGASNQHVNSSGWLRKFRSLFPASFRHVVKTNLPVWIQDKFTAYWQMERIKRDSPVLVIPSDFDGCLQINLQGREKHGVVPPQDYEKWLSILEQALPTFKDADTGEPIVRAVLRREQLGLRGANLHRFPDLTIKWHYTPVKNHRAVISERYGEVPWPTPGFVPTGRSGNHRAQGFLFAAGPGISPGKTLQNPRVIDLAPTIMHLLGLQPFPEMEGRNLFDD